MTCRGCGREAENGRPTHWLGCEDRPHSSAQEISSKLIMESVCDHDACSEPKKPWSGRGAKPRYCAAGHKKEK